VVVRNDPQRRFGVRGEGFGGQLIVVVPEHRLVVAVASQPTKDYATDSQVCSLSSPTSS
jgi:hypothetical protein